MLYYTFKLNTTQWKKPDTRRVLIAKPSRVRTYTNIGDCQTSEFAYSPRQALRILMIENEHCFYEKCTLLHFANT